MTLKTDPKNHGKIYEIASAMATSGLPPKFVQRAVALAIEYEGAFDLMVLWQLNQEDQEERAKIIADLEEHVDSIRDHAPIGRPATRPKIEFDNLENIANDIVAFKKRLRSVVDSKGGVPILAAKIGMSEPSLYRFFSSASLPRKTTLYRIANALDLDEREIAFEFTK